MSRYEDDATKIAAMLEDLKRYVADEHLAHKKKPLSEEYKIRIVNTGQIIPQQKNGSDCGVFLCQFMNYLATNDAFNFGQRHMRQLRFKMVVEILNKRLFDWIHQTEVIPRPKKRWAAAAGTSTSRKSNWKRKHTFPSGAVYVGEYIKMIKVPWKRYI